MSDNPLEKTPEREERIRKRAHQLWEADGRPVGREADYREQAEDLLAIEDNPNAGRLSPNPGRGDGGEEAEIQENYGEFPDRMTDQGDWRQTPFTREELRENEEGKLQPTRGDAP